jgi:hypothetical protein
MTAIGRASPSKRPYNLRHPSAESVQRGGKEGERPDTLSPLLCPSRGGFFCCFPESPQWDICRRNGSAVTITITLFVTGAYDCKTRPFFSFFHFFFFLCVSAPAFLFSLSVCSCPDGLSAAARGLLGFGREAHFRRARCNASTYRSSRPK